MTVGVNRDVSALGGLDFFDFVFASEVQLDFGRPFDRNLFDLIVPLEVEMLSR